MKIVINRQFGGFSLSRKAIERLRELGCPQAKEEVLKGEKYEDGTPCEHDGGGYDVPRNDPLLVQVVEELGDAADGACASLKVVEIPDGVDWEVHEYDGLEHVAEKHRTWA